METSLARTTTRVSAALATIAVLGLVAVAPTHAQSTDDAPGWTFDGRGGISVPAGDLADLPIEVGPSFGAGVGYYVTPRVAIRGDGSVELFSGDDLAGGGTGPDITLWHYNAGVEVELTQPGAGPWDVTANVAGGATTWDTDRFTSGTGTSDDLETYFTANGGLKAGYDVTPSVNVFVGGQWYLQFTDEEDTRALASLTPDLSEGFDTASTVPLYAGIEFKL